jgi:hypothetical protein
LPVLHLTAFRAVRAQAASITALRLLRWLKFCLRLLWPVLNVWLHRAAHPMT